ncbi:MAG: AAA family ATPase [Endomicrobiia bacterium]
MIQLSIKKIDIKNVGPIKMFHMGPGLVNCIYGKNESGKTFLVEFIIKCLFKETSLWQPLRNFSGEGKIEILINGNKEDFTFTGSKKVSKKIEDIIKLPEMVSLMRILIVKSGDINIGKETLSKEVLLNILSPEKTLDKINSKITSTVRNAKIDDGIINISNKGEGEDYRNIKNYLEEIDKLIKEVIEKYNPAEISELKKEKTQYEAKKEIQLKAKKYRAYRIKCEIEKIKEELRKLPTEEDISKIKNFINEYENNLSRLNDKKREIEKLQRECETLKKDYNEYEKLLLAKRYHAYKLSNEINQLQKELNKYSKEKINKLYNNINELKTLKDIIKEKSSKQKELENQAKYLEWLEAAKSQYSKIQEKPSNKHLSDFFLYISVGVIIISTLFLTLYGWKILSLVILASIFGVIYYFLKLKASFKNLFQSEEIKRLKNEFKEKFGEELRSEASITEKLNKAREAKGALEAIGIFQDITKYNLLFSEVKRLFKEITDENVEEEKFEEKLKQISEKSDEIDNKVRNLREQLAALNVNQKEYEENDPGVEFDQKRFEALSKKISELELKTKNITDLNNEIEDLQKYVNKQINEIKGWFKSYNLTLKESDNWNKKISDILNLVREKKQNVIHLEGELKGLEIDSSDYIKEEPAEEYSKSKLQEYEEKIQNLQEIIKQKEEQLQSLKVKVSTRTNKDITSNWDDLIKALFKLKLTKEVEYKHLIAKIVAGNLISETINSLKSKKEEILIECLNSKEVRKFIRFITKRYKRFKIENDNVIISDNYTDFDIRDLSTGAKEQVLLGIRIGIANRLLNKGSAFLIFDDAFQHVDWGKRPLLVKSLVKLSKYNWQIFYFTMDDNIKELFENERKLNSNVFIWNI